MSGRQMLTYHVIVPVLVFAALLASGAPLGTALAVGMMTGCVSIVVMMLGSAGEGERTSDATDAHAGRRWFDDMGAAAAVRPRFVARRVDTAGVAGAAMREC